MLLILFPIQQGRFSRNETADFLILTWFTLFSCTYGIPLKSPFVDQANSALWFRFLLLLYPVRIWSQNADSSQFSHGIEARFSKPVNIAPGNSFRVREHSLDEQVDRLNGNKRVGVNDILQETRFELESDEQWADRFAARRTNRWMYLSVVSFIHSFIPHSILGSMSWFCRII